MRASTTETKLISKEVKKTKVICDRCGKNINDHHNTPEGQPIEWATGYETKQTGVILRTGHMYPEGCWGETQHYDFCPECMLDLFLLIEQKFNLIPHKTEWEY